MKRHGAVMVVDGRGKLAGIITDGDIRRLMTKEGDRAFDDEGRRCDDEELQEGYVSMRWRRRRRRFFTSTG